MSMMLTKEIPMLVRNQQIDIETSDVSNIKNLQSSERNTDVMAHDLSEQQGIIFYQYNITLKKNIHKFLHSAVLLLA